MQAPLLRVQMLYNQMSEDEVARVSDVEKRADLCLEHFRLAAHPCHEAVWTLLTTTIGIIEDHRARFGPECSEFKGAMLNLARYSPMLIRWLKAKSECKAPSAWTPVWDPSLGGLAQFDLNTVLNYDAFQCTYPMWYQNRTNAEILEGTIVRFTVDGDGRDRQVSAYHKGLRPLEGIFKAIPGQLLEPTVGILRRYQKTLAGAHVTDSHGFSYEHPYELARRTKNKCLLRLTAILRRSETIDLGGYTLGTFKNFYAALQAVATIHDYLCFCWMKWGHPYPLSSAVIIKTKEDWVKLLAGLSGISLPTTEGIVDDLTFYSKRLPDLHVYPLVPLSDSHETLALVPQFVLNSAPEDNILRICSYLRQQVYDLLSNDKEATMREKIMDDLKQFDVHHSIGLPDGSTEIDLVIEDASSSTVVISELKWYRKPTTYRERLRADERFLDGVNRQVRTIRQFCLEHPMFLQERGTLKNSLSEYEHVYFVLIARDHWVWVAPVDRTTVVDFEQFRSAIGRHNTLHAAMSELIEYAWLPVEGRDFHVRFDRAVVESASVESEVFYAGPPAVSGNLQG